MVLFSLLDVVVYALDSSIVEFASPEDAQRAIRELSEQPLLGRPVFIREVSCLRLDLVVVVYIYIVIVRIVKVKLGLVRRPFPVRLVWQWLGRACTPPLRHDLLRTTTLG